MTNGARARVDRACGALAAPRPAARKFEDGKLPLEGQARGLQADDERPRPQGAPTPARRVAFVPASVTFLAAAEAGSGSRR